MQIHAWSLNCLLLVSYLWLEFPTMWKYGDYDCWIAFFLSISNNMGVYVNGHVLITTLPVTLIPVSLTYTKLLNIWIMNIQQSVTYSFVGQGYIFYHHIFFFSPTPTFPIFPFPVFATLRPGSSPIKLRNCGYLSIFYI